MNILLFVVSLFCTSVCAMDQEYFNNNVAVYAHGFGEGEKNNATAFYSHYYGHPVVLALAPDAPKEGPPDITKSVFYTQRAVHVLAETLKDEIITKNKKSLHLIGRSCGGGTTIKCLFELLKHKKEHNNYWSDTDISTTDATQIITALNNGSLHLTVPFLKLTKAKIIALPTEALGRLTLTAAFIAFYCTLRSYYRPLPLPYFTSPVLIGSFLLAQSMMGKRSGASYGWSVNNLSVPPLTNYNYNPTEPAPIDVIRNKPEVFKEITCPTLLHFCKNDGVLEDPDEDTEELYKAFSDNKNTHILISTDDSHNTIGQQYVDMLTNFAGTIFTHPNYPIRPRGLLQSTHPTVQELHSAIRPNFWQRCKQWIIYLKNFITKNIPVSPHQSFSHL